MTTQRLAQPSPDQRHAHSWTTRSHPTHHSPSLHDLHTPSHPNVQEYTQTNQKRARSQAYPSQAKPSQAKRRENKGRLHPLSNHVPRNNLSLVRAHDVRRLRASHRLCPPRSPRGEALPRLGVSRAKMPGTPNTAHQRHQGRTHASWDSINDRDTWPISASCGWPEICVVILANNRHAPKATALEQHLRFASCRACRTSDMTTLVTSEVHNG
jgi:hypothetical protein